MTKERIFREESDIVKKNNPYIEGTTLSSKDLPSSGLFYPNGLEISYRLFSFGELKFLFPKKLDSENPVTVKEYVDVCLKGFSFSVDFDPYEMCWYDFIYISLLRKFPSLARSMDDPYEIITNCKHCGSSNISTLDLDTLEFKSLENKDNLKIEHKGEVMEFKPMTLRTYIELLDLSVSNPQLDADISIIAASLISDLSLVEKYNKIYNVQDHSLMEALFELDSTLNLGLLPHDVTCKKCHGEYSVSLQSAKVEYSLAFPRLV